MSKQLYSFDLQDMQSNGRYLKLSKAKDEGFQLKDLEELQRKMIESNDIPRLTPIRFEDQNHETFIYYRIEGLRVLRTLMKEQPLSMNEFYTVFIQITQALQEASNHMLNENRFVLDEDFIYIGRNVHQVYLTYLPIVDVEEERPVYEQLKHILLSVAGEVKNINGAQFKQILSYLKDPGFSLEGLKQLLQTLLGTEEEVEEVQPEFSQPSTPETVMKTVKKLPPLDSKTRTYSFIITALFIASCWILFENPVFAIIGSLIVIAGLLVLLFVWRPGAEPIVTEKEVVVKKPTSTKTGHSNNRAVQNQNQPTNQTADFIQREVRSEQQRNDEEMVRDMIQQEKLNVSQDETKEVEQEVEQPVEHTNVNTDGVEIPHAVEPIEIEENLAPVASTIEADEIEEASQKSPEIQTTHDQTILLDSIEVEEPESEIANYLMKTDEHAEESRVELVEEHVTIGRSDRATDVVDEGTGVSRVHVEFVKLSDMYGIKDLGSKNGTTLNDERLIPYKIYELKHDDVVKIGKSTYVYKVTTE